MLIFHYQWQATTSDKQQRQGQTWAINRNALQKQVAKEEKQYIYTCKIIGIQWLSFCRAKHLALFFKQFAMLLEAGFSLLAALKLMQEQRLHARLNFILKQTIRKVTAGHPLSEAFSQYPETFESLCISLIKAGEDTGKFHFCLQKLHNYYQRRMDYHKQIHQAMIYPASIMLFGLLLIVGLMHWALPQTAAIFSQSGHALPLLTAHLLNGYAFCVNYGWVIVTMFMVLIMVFIKYPHRIGDYLWDRLPWISTLRSDWHRAHFMDVLSLCYASGLNPIQSIQCAMRTTTCSKIKQHQQQIVAFVEDGHLLSNSFESLQILPPFLIKLFKVGEQTGQFEKMSAYIAQWLESTAKDKIKITIKFIEPVLLCLLAILIGTLMLALYLPIFQLIDLAG